MPDKAEKARRKEILHAQHEQARRKMREALPADAQTLKALFDHVDSRLESTECDNSLQHTLDFIKTRSLPEANFIAWLEENGGYCDCEVLANVEQVVENAVPGYRDLE